MDKISTSFCWLLRHGAIKAGVDIDIDGYVRIQDLIDWYNTQNPEAQISEATVYSVVNLDEKDRYVIFGDSIRCVQGHSIPGIAHDNPITEWTGEVYHGTAQRFLKSILRYGLLPVSRNFVHFSKDYDTALEVGARHGKPVVLRIDREAFGYGNCLREARNGVLLSGKVDPKYISFDIELTQEEKTEIYTTCQTNAMRLRWLSKESLLHHINTHSAYKHLPPINMKQLEEIHAEGVSL